MCRHYGMGPEPDTDDYTFVNGEAFPREDKELYYRRDYEMPEKKMSDLFTKEAEYIKALGDALLQNGGGRAIYAWDLPSGKGMVVIETSEGELERLTEEDIRVYLRNI